MVVGGICRHMLHFPRGSGGHGPHPTSDFFNFELSESGLEVFWDNFEVLVAVILQTEF